MSYKTTLVFSSNKQLIKLATETKSHTKFRLPYSEKTTSEKGVFFVKDEGIYLMNAFTQEKGETPSKSGLVTYALGYDPKKNDDVHQDCVEAVGGDDFGEFLPLSDEQLDRIINGGKVWVRVTQEEIEVSA